MAGRTTEGEVRVSDGTQSSGAAGGGHDPWAPPEPGLSLNKDQPAAPGAGQPPAQPPSVHDQATVTDLPTGGYAQPNFAPPVPGFGAPTPPAFGAPGTGEPVPPPPIAPTGPGVPPVSAPPAGGYGYPGYPAGGGYGWTGMPMTPQNGMGTAAMVLGILSICLFCLYGVASVILGTLAVVFGVKGRRRAERGEATNHGQAQAGLIMGVIGIIVGVAVIVLLAIGITAAINEDHSSSDPYYGSLHSVSAPVTVAAQS
ncbi:DUF4190 domain-containing protein [Streptomyces griseofuscus]|nr:DUF4190 domain-containing protein [Streptomyces griseofuscus]